MRILYKIRRSVVKAHMPVSGIKDGDGQPWTPNVKIKGGSSGFYLIGGEVFSLEFQAIVRKGDDMHQREITCIHELLAQYNAILRFSENCLRQGMDRPMADAVRDIKVAFSGCKDAIQKLQDRISDAEKELARHSKWPGLALASAQFEDLSEETVVADIIARLWPASKDATEIWTQGGKMRLNEFVDRLRNCPEANDLSVYSDGGYCYMVVDKTGKRITPAELGITLTLEGGDYVRVDANVYSRTATITPSNDKRDDCHVRAVKHFSRLSADIVTGDIP